MSAVKALDRLYNGLSLCSSTLNGMLLEINPRQQWRVSCLQCDSLINGSYMQATNPGPADLSTLFASQEGGRHVNTQSGPPSCTIGCWYYFSEPPLCWRLKLLPRTLKMPCKHSDSEKIFCLYIMYRLNDWAAEPLLHFLRGSVSFPSTVGYISLLRQSTAVSVSGTMQWERQEAWNGWMNSSERPVFAGHSTRHVNSRYEYWCVKTWEGCRRMQEDYWHTPPWATTRTVKAAGGSLGSSQGRHLGMKNIWVTLCFFCSFLHLKHEKSFFSSSN